MGGSRMGRRLRPRCARCALDVWLRMGLVQGLEEGPENTTPAVPRTAPIGVPRLGRARGIGVGIRPGRAPRRPVPGAGAIGVPRLGHARAVRVGVCVPERPPGRLRAHPRPTVGGVTRVAAGTTLGAQGEILPRPRSAKVRGMTPLRDARGRAPSARVGRMSRGRRGRRVRGDGTTGHRSHALSGTGVRGVPSGRGSEGTRLTRVAFARERGSHRRRDAGTGHGREFPISLERGNRVPDRGSCPRNGPGLRCPDLMDVGEVPGGLLER